ncbi:MAG: SMI1/KNR4 family protein [Micromonosporaceae bacterium]
MAGPPLSSYAGQIVRFAAPLLRIRYRDGLYVTLHGFPDWFSYARALVELAPPPASASADEVRVIDVLAANQVMLAAGDPLWTAPEMGAVATPDGWAWAHLARSRRLALVPAEAYAAFRHAGGIATLDADHSGSGLVVPRARGTVSLPGEGPAPEKELTELEGQLPAPLPAAYREFLAATNGGRPATPAVHPRFGFVVDQTFFGFGRRDWFGNLSHVRQWLKDKFTADFLPIGHVQGGTLAVRLTGEDAGSVWYYDDDDPRDDDSYDADEVAERLLRRCADSFDRFVGALVPVPDTLIQAAQTLVRDGGARQLPEPGLGLGLPTDKRPPAPSTGNEPGNEGGR